MASPAGPLSVAVTATVMLLLVVAVTCALMVGALLSIWAMVSRVMVSLLFPALSVRAPGCNSIPIVPVPVPPVRVMVMVPSGF